MYINHHREALMNLHRRGGSFLHPQWGRLEEELKSI